MYSTASLGIENRHVLKGRLEKVSWLASAHPPRRSGRQRHWRMAPYSWSCPGVKTKVTSSTSQLNRNSEISVVRTTSCSNAFTNRKMISMELPIVKGDEKINFDFVVVAVRFCCCDDATNASLAQGAHVKNEVGTNCN
jgi:hypothetical protein